MNLSKLNDLSLVAQVIAGANGRAFELLVRKYQGQVRRFFLHQTLGDRMQSDDLSQETFIKAYRQIASFRSLSSFPTWLYSIAYNVWLDHLRAKRQTIQLDEALPVASEEGKNNAVDTKIDLYEALKLLTDAERTCITLFYLDDLPIRQVANITSMPESTVKSHLSRGKQKMATYLKQHGYE